MEKPLVSNKPTYSPIKKLSTAKIIVFALGQPGWALASFAPGNLLVYLYMPPDTGVITFPARIYQGYVLGFVLSGWRLLFL